MKRAKQTAGNLVIALDDSVSGNPHDNLARLERAARYSIAFGSDLDFDAECWDIQTRTANRRLVRLWFRTHDNVSDDAGDLPRMQESFANFVKSVIRLSQAADPRGPERHEALLRAARYLYQQLGSRGYDPIYLRTVDFQEAERAAIRRERSPWSHFAIAQSLLKLASIVREQRLSRASINFVPVTPAPDYEDERTDTPPDPNRLPSPAALDALPRIAQEVTDPADVCMMRTIALLHCAPWRIGELLSLPEDCEVVMSPDGRDLSVKDLEDGKPVRYGLRYKPEKNPDMTSDVKWLPSAVIPLVRRALKDLREHTAATREIAAYMEDNPGRAWLPARFRNRERLEIDDLAEILERPRELVYLWLRNNEFSIRPDHVRRDEFEEGLTATLSAKANEQKLIADARALLAERPESEWFDILTIKKFIRVIDIYRWLRVKGVPVHPDSISRNALEAKLLEMNYDVSADFPWKRSECLFLFPKLFFKLGPQLRPVVSLMNRDQLRFFITGDKNNKSIFARLDYKEPNGKKIRVTSHMFRRWLGTLAINSEMSAEQVRDWLGHTSVRPQGAYDRRTPQQMAEEARKAIGSGRGIGALADIARSKEPRDRDRFLEGTVAAVHITPFGMCVRDWTVSPCARHGACAACEMQMITKGDPGQRNQIARSLRENQILLDRAMAEVEDGQAGADDHAWHLVREVTALEATLAVHDDPSIADGTLVQLDLPAIVAKAEAAG
ncbi:hypothetical protein GPL21_06975 [Bradyrhizobium pachyrhizi]|uniref:Integrase n=1 Tax=Bradyrhizobium pachyrhizi TaxID=280333 RepID=A0A844SCT4_9BRAD|nr:hypothetical protein [Bradyrhizobium pachyrhizi]MVT64848.1 hypothetical protein [Bradyrhizobium pachyrhizi]